MKFIIVAPNLSPKGLASSYRIGLIIEYFLKNGYEITLFTSVYPIKPELVGKENLKVYYVKNNRDSNYINKIFSKVFGIPDPMIFWSLKIFFKILKDKKKYKKFDYVFCSSPPHSLHTIGLLAKKFLKISFISDFRDDWMSSHRLNHLTFLHRYLSSRNESKVINDASAVFNAIPVVAKDLKLKYPKSAKKIFIATNGFNQSFNEKMSDDSFGIKYKYKTIVYCGGGYKGFITKKFNDLANDLISAGLDSNWRIISAGPGIKVEPNNLAVWKHYGLVTSQEVEELMVNATIHLSILPEGDLLNSRTIPLKMYSQVVTKGSIVFIGNEGITNEVFAGLDGVFFLGYDSWNKLSEFIKSNEKDLVKKHVRLVNKFNFEYIMEDYLNHLKNISI